MKLEQFQAWALSCGWTLDNWGHFKKHTDKGLYRFKVQSRSIRLEKQISFPAGEYSPARNEWMRVRSGYLKSLSISADNKLVGLSK